MHTIRWALPPMDADLSRANSDAILSPASATPNVIVSSRSRRPSCTIDRRITNASGVEREARVGDDRVRRLVGVAVVVEETPGRARHQVRKRVQRREAADA